MPVTSPPVPASAYHSDPTVTFLALINSHSTRDYTRQKALQVIHQTWRKITTFLNIPKLATSRTHRIPCAIMHKKTSILSLHGYREYLIILLMIRSFGNRTTEDFYHGRRTAQSRKITSTIRASAIRKLDILNTAATIDDLRSPPGNRLEKLSGDLAGFHSVRINQQWRLIFRWIDGGAEGVEIVDYHG